MKTWAIFAQANAFRLAEKRVSAGGLARLAAIKRMRHDRRNAR
jgi:hypothetical protein